MTDGTATHASNTRHHHIPPSFPQVVARLKQQVQELKEELAMATGEEREDDLTQEERERSGRLATLYASHALQMHMFVDFREREKDSVPFLNKLYGYEVIQ